MHDGSVMICFRLYKVAVSRHVQYPEDDQVVTRSFARHDAHQRRIY